MLNSTSFPWDHNTNLSLSTARGFLKTSCAQVRLSSNLKKLAPCPNAQSRPDPHGRSCIRSRQHGIPHFGIRKPPPGDQARRKAEPAMLTLYANPTEIATTDSVVESKTRNLRLEERALLRWAKRSVSPPCPYRCSARQTPVSQSLAPFASPCERPIGRKPSFFAGRNVAHGHQR